MTPGDYEFLEELESRIDTPWTEEESLRVWRLHPHMRSPPADIRGVYARLKWRRQEIIAEIRAAFVEATIKRLDE